MCYIKTNNYCAKSGKLNLISKNFLVLLETSKKILCEN